MLRQQAHFLHHFLHLPHAVGFVFKEVEVIQALGNDVIHGGPLVQGRGGILEHHLDIPDDLPVQGMGNLSGDAHTLIVDLAASQGIDPDYGAADGGLAGTGLAHQGEGLPLINVKRRILNGADRVIPLTEGNVHIFQGQEDLPAGRLINGTMLRQPGTTSRFFIFLLQCSHFLSSPLKY